MSLENSHKEKYRIGFIIEQALGHITHAQNLQEHIHKDTTIQAYWGLPSWQGSRSILDFFPPYKSNWTIRAGLQSRRLLSEIQRQAQLDALFFHTQVAAVLAQDWLGRIPGVISLDATPIQYDALGSFYQHHKGPDWLETWKWRLNRDCLRKARHIVTWSNWAKQGLVDDYEVPAEKISVIPPGVTTADWNKPEPWHKKPGPVKILFVGGNLERKGGHILLEAFRSLKSEPISDSLDGSQVSIELHLVTRDQVQPEPGLTIYSDMQPNSPALKGLYFNSDIFCLPTLGDCLPMALMEAGAAGLPTISTKVAAIPEIVFEGKTGFTVPPGDGQALIEAMRTLIANQQLRKEMGNAALRIVSEGFDAECNTRRLVQVLKSVINKVHFEGKQP